MNTMLLLAISELFPDDSIRPGLVLSYLVKQGRYYGSVCRYPSRNEKAVVTTASEDTLDKTLEELSKNLLTFLGRGTHVANLEKAINASIEKANPDGGGA